MPFLDNLDLVVLERELEERNDLGIHELRGDRSAPHARKLLFNEANILARLHDADLIFAALGCNAQ